MYRCVMAIVLLFNIHISLPTESKRLLLVVTAVY